MESVSVVPTVRHIGGADRFTASGRWELFREGPSGGDTDEALRRETGTSRGADEGSGAVLLCRGCAIPITSEGAAIQVDGRGKHTFFNPAGRVFEIQCFAVASGCVVNGVPSGEFAWFRGYLWQYGTCSGCGAHLGWYFSSSGASGFYGLILSRLVEGEGGTNGA